MYVAFIIAMVFVGLFVYAVIAKLTYHLYYDGLDSLFDDGESAMFASVFWVVTLPVCGGIVFGHWCIKNEFGMVCINAFKNWVANKRKKSRD